MPLYSYKAKDAKNKVIEDVIQASNRSEAASIISENKLKVLTLKSLDKKFNPSIGGNFTIAEKASFCRFMATMLRAGLPLTEAIDNIREETKNEKLKNILFDISFQIRKGSNLSSALSKYKKEFDGFFLTMIKAGEKSGSVDKSFDYLARQLLASHDLNQKIKGAMMYPAIIIVAMLGNAIVMMVFVLPKLAGVFTELDIELPIYTKIVLEFGNYVGENTVQVLGIMVLLGLLFMSLFFIKQTKAFLFTLLLKVPAVGNLVVSIDVARFSRTISTLLQSGVPITVALEVAGGVLRTPKLVAKASFFSEGVSQGEQLSELFKKGDRVFPPVMVQTIKAGEKSGSLGEVLEELSEFYEREVDYSLKRATALIEPVLMLIIGIAVGGLVLMMITPIYSLVSGFNTTV